MKIQKPINKLPGFRRRFFFGKSFNSCLIRSILLLSTILIWILIGFFIRETNWNHFNDSFFSASMTSNSNSNKNLKIFIFIHFPPHQQSPNCSSFSSIKKSLELFSKQRRGREKNFYFFFNVFVEVLLLL